jgi:hypothetical protein
LVDEPPESLTSTVAPPDDEVVFPVRVLFVATSARAWRWVSVRDARSICRRRRRSTSSSPAYGMARSADVSADAATEMPEATRGWVLPAMLNATARTANRVKIRRVRLDEVRASPRTARGSHALPG